MIISQKEFDVLDRADILVTGGAGFLGKAIAHRRNQELWQGKLTVYSRDTFKHAQMKRQFPDVAYVSGDIQDYMTLLNAMTGHDVVIHAAAVKVVPTCEYDVSNTIGVNVLGTQNVCAAAVQAGVSHVIFISTDKAVHPTNTYGASKMLGERLLHEYVERQDDVKFHIVRYGNVLSSTGSFVHMWRNDMRELGFVRSTNPEMTRFWLTQEDAVDIVVSGLEQPSGTTYVPILKSASMGSIIEWIVPGGYEVKFEGVRPGEKIHEELVSEEESWRSVNLWKENAILISAPTSAEMEGTSKITSENAERLTKEEFLEMIGE